MENIKSLSEKYLELSKDINVFTQNMKKISELSLDIFYEIAKIYELPTQEVSLKAITESVEFRKIFEQIISVQLQIPEWGDFSIKENQGTVIFVDITKSTSYFKSEKDIKNIDFVENYTGFVIFNAYILLVKTITKLTDGKFLEHTGDGAMIFFEGKDIIEDYINHHNEEGICYFYSSINPICLYFIVSEHIKNYAKEKNLLNFEIIMNKTYQSIYPTSYKEPSLIHLGASYGKVSEIMLGNMEKLVSQTVWKAADRCKKSIRHVKYIYEDNSKVYTKLPINI